MMRTSLWLLPLAVVSALSAQDAGDADKHSAEHVTARRLNRNEYNNTIRDLLGVTFRPADDFPQDDTNQGFDNIADVLSLPPVLMEKYLTAAERITRTALHGPEAPKATSIRYYPYRYRPSENPFIGKEGYTLTHYDLSGLTMPTAFHAMHRFPVEAEYFIKVTGDGVRPAGSDPLQVGFWIDGKLQPKIGELSNKFYENGSVLIEGQTAEIRLRIPAGDHWVAVSFLKQFEGLPAAYGALNPSKSVPPERPAARAQTPPANATPEELAEFKRRQEAAAKRPPRLERADLYRVRFIEIGGPFQPSSGPSPDSLAKIFTCGHLDGKHQPSCARKIVTDLAGRAFRRPASPQKIARLMALVTRSQKRGDPFEDSIGLAIQAILVSPDFLFRLETDAAATTASAAAPAVSDYELASRLSYYLWSSMPDDELLRVAGQKSLRKPEVLAAQVRRMLADPKSRALVEDFGGQWLQTRGLESVKPDPLKFERWDEYLRLSMRKETEMFFQNIIREDRPILDFVDADYTFVNDRLAHHYGIEGIEGPEFRKVNLAGTHRGGILSQASVLTVSSYANRTSTVLRGKWILENILNAPIPDPPPGIPPIDEAAVGTATSLRAQMEKHRANAACAVCHARMDPLGFSLENYDAVGAWRTEDGKFPINAAGALPDGRTFQGPDDLRKILMADRGLFADCITVKMLTYALGRGLGEEDKPVVKSIANAMASQDYRFSSLVLGIVNSAPFQTRRGGIAK